MIAPIIQAATVLSLYPSPLQQLQPPCLHLSRSLLLPSAHPQPRRENLNTASCTRRTMNLSIWLWLQQARLDRQRVCDHERRAAEHPAARQARQDRHSLINFVPVIPPLQIRMPKLSSSTMTLNLESGLQPQRQRNGLILMLKFTP